MARVVEESPFDCNICLCIPEAQVHQCVQGHLFCADCLRAHQASDQERANACPVCRTTLPAEPIRSRIAESSIGELPSACPHCNTGMLRKQIADHYLKFNETLQHYFDAPVPPMEHQNLLLSKYCVDAKKKVDYKTGKLQYTDYATTPRKPDFVTYPKSIFTLLEKKSFFKRFHKLKLEVNRQIYEDVIRASEIELYDRD